MFLPWKRWCLTPSIRLFYITFTFRMNLSVMGLSTLKGWGKPLNSHSFISFINMSDSSFWKCVCVYIIWNLQTIKWLRDNFFFHSKFSYIYWISFILKLRTKLIHGWMQINNNNNNNTTNDFHYHYHNYNKSCRLEEKKKSSNVWFKLLL